jgi:hypothetical protein
VKKAGAPGVNQSLTTPQPTAPGPPRPRPRRHQRGAGPCRCCRSPGRWRVGRLLSRLVHHRALGADLPHRCRQSRDGRRPSEDIKADPGAGVPATSGLSRIPQRPLTAGDGVAPTHDLTRSAKRTVALPPITPNGDGIVNHREHLNEHRHDHSDLDEAQERL